MSFLPPLSTPSQSLRLPSLVGLKRARDAFPLEAALDKENASNKCSLAFILSTEQPAAPRLPSLSSLTLAHVAAPAQSVWGTPQKPAAVRQAPALHPSAKFARCQSAVVSHLHAPASGAASTTATAKKGSKYCMVDGCTSRAKHARRCWRHGGSVKCKVPDCSNRAKTKGVCWSHGGGTTCAFAGCSTISVSNGVCWAHGGGKRCAIEGCARPAYERTKHLCTLHFEQKQYIARLRGVASLHDRL